MNPCCFLGGVPCPLTNFRSRPGRLALLEHIPNPVWFRDGVSPRTNIPGNCASLPSLVTLHATVATRTIVPYFGETVMGKLRFGITTVLIAVSQFASAHGGGLNAEGCHNNRKTGDYHCHRAPTQRVDARAELLSSPSVANNEIRTSAAPVVQPTTRSPCYTGPRGGTYTITASGRKNYSGC